MADDRRQLDELLAAVDARLSALLMPVARDLARLVRRAPKDASGTLSVAGRLGVTRWLTGALAALFGDSPADAEAKYASPGTVPHLLAASTRAAARLAVGPVVADVTRRLGARPDLLAALTTPPGARKPIFDPARTWVDPNGYRLSDRIWQDGQDIRARIDALLDYHIARGTTGTAIASELEPFLTLEGAAQRTRTPYGRVGSHRSRTLARTEVSRAYNASAAEAARSNPFVRGIGYRRSSNHPEEDECDVRANADPDGLGRGNYLPGNFPAPPTHPNCRCYVVSVQADDAAVTAKLRQWVNGGGDGLPLDEAAIVASVTGF
jgi:hypothetical protein